MYSSVYGIKSLMFSLLQWLWFFHSHFKIFYEGFKVIKHFLYRMSLLEVFLLRMTET